MQETVSYVLIIALIVIPLVLFFMILVKVMARVFANFSLLTSAPFF